MKKWQIGILWLAIGQAITMYKKDAHLRKKVQSEEGLLGKAKVIGEKWIQDNKEIFEDLKNNDWDKTVADIEQDFEYDKTKVEKRGKEQMNKDWEKEWHEVVRSVISKVPDKKTLANWVEKYKQRIIKWWDSL